uniref:BPTI/Kunitz inhibitor domain-containing protein n=1 Tax=Angiostrongylus cantonensis TaxID=6313 RepID=A0A0K0DGK5_ANGCA
MPRILTGPCTQNEVGMKCTEKGFFETVQCDIYGCYCVSAHNGFIAYDTRTANNQTLPTCSRCHKALEHLYANGIPPEGTLIPTCDVASGNYEPMQCNLQQQRCYCVDPLTGDEIANTSKRMTSNEYIRFFSLSLLEFLVKPTPLSTLNGVMLWKKDYPVPGKPCTLDRDRGVLHGSVKPSVRYYFDYETTVCLAFEYLGSGGNDNNYEEISDCLLSCTYRGFEGGWGSRSPLDIFISLVSEIFLLCFILTLQ